MSDLIDRQAAINKHMIAVIDGVEVVPVSYIKSLPSTPEIIRCRECAKRRTLDCPMGITVFDAPPSDGYCYKAERRDACEAIFEAPSVQPEPLTDKEKRIFLAAMGREEDVCKQVDAECRDCREPYEDSLVRTCHEIIRKVKGALWT